MTADQWIVIQGSCERRQRSGECLITALAPRHQCP